MSDVSLSKAVRQNLLSLQSTANSMAKTQTRLATGLKVNTALDNPTNFFTAASLNGRAGDMANLLDSMASGIKTIEAADNGLSSITKTVESMQSTLRQARQDKSFKTQSFAVDPAEIGTSGTKSIQLSGGTLGNTPVSVDLTQTGGSPTPASITFNFSAISFDSPGDDLDMGLQIDGVGVYSHIHETSATAGTVGNDGVIDTAAEMKAVLEHSFADNAILGLTVTNTATTITITGSTTGPGASLSLNPSLFGGSEGGAATLTGFAGMGAATATPGGSGATSVKTVDQLVTDINGNALLKGAVRASNDGGKLRIENQSTSPLTVAGVSGTGSLDGSSGTSAIEGNDVRKNLAKQFNDLRDQLDKFADDASFNGINLLRGDKLKLTFNETGTSTIEIQAKDESGAPTSVNNAALGIDAATNADFASDDKLDKMLDGLKGALDDLRSQSSTFGSSLSVVENRNDFTKKMINTLETGAANLTLADTNEEAANLLALQTRQQLSSSALSMASQADQAVLRLF